MYLYFDCSVACFIVSTKSPAHALTAALTLTSESSPVAEDPTEYLT